MDFFAVKAALYTNDGQWQQVPDNDKQANAWVLSRNLAIAYPVIMQQFNKLGMNAIAVLNAMHLFVKSGRQPGWSFISNKQCRQPIKEAVTDTDKCLQYNADTIKAFCHVYDIDRRTFEAYATDNGSECLAELEELEKQLT